MPLGMTFKLHLLSNHIVECYDKEAYSYFTNKIKPKKFTFSEEQQKAFQNMSKNRNSFKVHLLQGTTGSGKTLVYFKSIMEKISQGKQVLILLPEIGLTYEFERKFKEYFGFNAAVWHSSITKKIKK